MESEFNFDVLIIGTGSAGLMNALQLDDKLEVALIAKDKILEAAHIMLRVEFLLYLINLIIFQRI